MRIWKNLKEPSTWAAIAVPFTALGAQIPTPWSIGAYIFSAFAASLGILLREGGANDAT
jgi:hypothetical protein